MSASPPFFSKEFPPSPAGVVGHIPGTPLPTGGAGNVAVAGHRDSYFRGLKDIERGDIVDVRTPAGTHRYRVEWTRIVEPGRSASSPAPTSLPSPW